MKEEPFSPEYVKGEATETTPDREKQFYREQSSEPNVEEYRINKPRREIIRARIIND